MSIKKMKQVEIKKATITSGFFNEKLGEMKMNAAISYDNNVVVYKKENVEDIRISESVFTREFNNLNSFMIFSFKGFAGKLPAMEKEVLNNAFDKGVVVNGVIYKPFIQSSSQNRDNELVFTSLEDRVSALSKLMKIDLNTHVDFNMSVGEGGEIVVNKFMARAGMTLANGLATTVSINSKNFTVIKDYVSNLEVQGNIFNYDLSINERFELEEAVHPVTDGQNYMSIVIAAKITKDIGKLSVSDYKYFVRNWKGFKSLEDNSKLSDIFNSFEKVFQLRAPGIKGLFIAIDFYSLRNEMDLDIVKGHNPMSNDIHFIIGEGGLKYVPDETIYLEYMESNRDKRLSQTLSMQTLNSLGMSVKDMEVLTSNAIELFSKVLEDADYALEFLGCYFPTNLEAEAVEQTLVTKVHKALVANPEALKERWVQKALINKLVGVKNNNGSYESVGAVIDAKFGKLPIKGNFFFIIADPYAHLGLDRTLKSGEIHFNDYSDTEVALFRYPNVHESEIVKKNISKVSVYSYIKNVIILNTFDDTLPRLGGSDCDGDKYLAVFDEVVIKNIPSNHVVLPYGEGSEANKNELTLESYNNTLKQSVMIDSQIGPITNYATVWRDAQNSLLAKGIKPELANAYGEKVLDLRFLQGYEIDKAKTGDIVEIPKDLKPNFVPIWFFRYQLEVKGVSIDALRKNYTSKNSEKDFNLVHKSSSSLAHNYRRMKEFVVSLEEKVKNSDKGSAIDNFMSGILNHKDFNKEDSSIIFDSVKALEKEYRSDFRTLSFIEDEDTKKYFSSQIFVKYQGLMNAIDASDITKLYVAYTIVGNTESKSDSFYRAFCFDALVNVYEGLAPNKSVLIKVTEGTDKVTVKGGKVYFDGNLVSDKEFDVLKGVRNSYNTFELTKGTYVRALVRNDFMFSDFKEDVDENMSLKFIGLKYNDFKDMTKEEVKERLSNSLLTLNSVEYNNEVRVGLFSDDSYVGLVPKYSHDYASRFLGFELNYINSLVFENKNGEVNAIDPLEFTIGSKVVEANEVEIEKDFNETIIDSEEIVDYSYEEAANAPFSIG